jgi:hypothetical protein
VDADLVEAHPLEREVGDELLGGAAGASRCRPAVSSPPSPSAVGVDAEAEGLAVEGVELEAVGAAAGAGADGGVGRVEGAGGAVPVAVADVVGGAEEALGLRGSKATL